MELKIDTDDIALTTIPGAPLMKSAVTGSLGGTWCVTSLPSFLATSTDDEELSKRAFSTRKFLEAGKLR